MLASVISFGIAAGSPPASSTVIGRPVCVCHPEDDVMQRSSMVWAVPDVDVFVEDRAPVCTTTAPDRSSRCHGRAQVSIT